MALTYAFKQSVKQRSRRSRRMQVGVFVFFVALGLAEGAGREGLGVRIFPFLFAIGLIHRDWRLQRTVKVSSLDDRAMLEHGVLFDQLTQPEQKDLLRRYRVGTFVMGYYPDERDDVAEQESAARAYGMLRWLLPLLAIVYWVGWKLLPDGGVREGWTNGPTVLAWMFLVVLALPQMIRLWTEPDEVAEPRVVAGAEV